MKRVVLLLIGSLTAFALPIAAQAGGGGAATPAKPADIAAAVAAPDRPADDIKLDAGRQPVAVLGFFGLKPGMQVADIMAGNGYYTEIMAHAVGPKGKVTAFEPTQFGGDAKATATWTALAARVPNATRTLYSFESFAAPANSFDFALLHLVYHDLYWESAQFKVTRTDPAAFLAVLYQAMKPGGIVGVVDHVASPGDTRATVDKLHRVDPATVSADFVKAGFVLDGESKLLRNATDDHSTLVFVPAVRGKTDRFVMRFRKPAKR